MSNTKNDVSSNEKPSASSTAPRIKDSWPLKSWGMTDEELATYPMVFRDDLLKDMVFVVSGGGTGLGRAMAYLFARLGGDVMICGRRKEALDVTAKGIRKHLGKEIATYPMTIRDSTMVESLIKETWGRFGRLDVVVNNGGGQFPQASIDYTVKGWLAVIDTNLNGSWYMMQSAARQWVERKAAGHIINIVANVQRGMPQVSHTCAARAGVIYLSKSLATEWAQHQIRVNCISPSCIATEGFNVYPPDAAEQMKRTNPMQSLGDMYDIAQAAVYLAAPSGKFITGDVIAVDGGNANWSDWWPAGRPAHFKVQE
jgi:citronellol/citronellal dehydrogenase